MARTCINCKSSDIKQITAAILQLTQETTSSTSTIAAGIVSGGKMGIGGAKSSGSSSSAPILLKRLRNKFPTRSGKFVTVLYVFIFFFFLFLSVVPSSLSNIGQENNLLLIWVAYIIVIIFGYLFYKAFQSRRKYKSKLDRCNRTWYCFSCGQYTIFKS